MSSTDGVAKNAILSGLVTLIKTIANFDNHVYKGYRTSMKDSYEALLHLTEDEIVLETTGHEEHLIRITLMIKVRSDIKGNAEDQMEDYIEFIGVVHDLLKANASISDHWDNLSRPLTTYTFGADRTFNYYNALIELEVRAQW